MKRGLIQGAMCYPSLNFGGVVSLSARHILIPSNLSNSTILLTIMVQRLELQPLQSLFEAEYRLKYPSQAGHSYDKMVVGAVMFHSSSSPPAKMLLLKRAANEKFYPNMFPIPGGNVEDTDAVIFQVLVREVHEETAPSFVSIKASIEPFAYSTEKTVQAR